MKPAVRYLAANGGELSSTGLKIVLEEEMQRRIFYYESRAEKVTRNQRRAIARFPATTSAGDGFDLEDLVDALKADFKGRDEAEMIVRTGLHSGLLDMHKGVCMVPIPSMHKWLVDGYSQN